MISETEQNSPSVNSLSPRQARTNVLFIHTHSLPITTGSGQTTTHYSSSYLCISKLPNYQIWLTQISPLSHPDSYNTLYQDKLSGQSNTSPKLRWTGNSPIWGKITVPTGVTSIYDYPTRTDLTYANLTTESSRLIQHSDYTYRHKLTLVLENDQPHRRPLYTPLASRKFQSRIYQRQLPAIITRPDKLNRNETSRINENVEHI